MDRITRFLGDKEYSDAVSGAVAKLSNNPGALTAYLLSFASNEAESYVIPLSEAVKEVNQGSSQMIGERRQKSLLLPLEYWGLRF